MTQITSEKYVYVFVRQDIPLEHQAIQSLHAILQMATNYRPEEGIPNIVYIGVPDKNALNRVLKKLKDHQIPQFPWIEPDNDFGFTSIATIPLTDSIRCVLRNYRLLKFDRGPGQPACGVNADPVTKLPDGARVSLQ